MNFFDGPKLYDVGIKTRDLNIRVVSLQALGKGRLIIFGKDMTFSLKFLFKMKPQV